MKNTARIIVGLCLFLACFGGMVMAQQEVEKPAYLVIQFDVRAERLAEFTDIMAGVKQAMKTEEGFEDAYVLTGMDAPHQFILIERWRNKKLHLEHFDKIVASGDWQNIREMLSSAPVMQYTTMMYVQ